MIIEKLNEYRQSMDEHNEKFNKELENIKKTQTTKEYNSKLYDREEQITELEDKVMELRAEKKKRILKSKGTLRDLWDNIKQTSIYLIVVQNSKEERAIKLI